MARLILTTPGEDTPAGGNADVIGTAAPGEVITLFPGVITLDPSFNLGGDVLVFPEARSAYTVVRDGSNVVIRSDDLTVTIPFGTAGIELRFADETLVLRIANNQLLLGDQVVTNTEAPIGGESGLAATPIDAGTVGEDGAPVHVNLLSTASDSDGDTLSIGTIVSATTNTGRVVATTLNGSTLSIDPDQFNNLDDGEAETVTVRYTITDGDGTIQNEVTLRVTGADDVPTSGPLFPADITEDDPPLVIDLLSRADDPDGEPVNVGNILSVQTSSGQPLVYTRNGNSITIDPSQFGDALDDGEAERVVITYSITDGDGLQAINTLNLIIEGADDGAEAVDDAAATDEETALFVTAAAGVLVNDIANTPGTTLTLSAVEGSAANIGTQITLASGALVTLNADGSYSYDPNGAFEDLAVGETGTDSFTYEVSDNNGLSDTGTVVITISGVNDPPVANDDSFTGPEDSILTGNVLDNDSDDGTTLSATLVTGPTNAASFTLNADGSFSYTPPANFAGPDSFTYRINDGTVDGNVATVSLFISQVDDPPVAVDDSYNVVEDTPTVLNVLANDSDPDGSALQFESATDPAHGSVQINGDGTLTYTPDPDYNGPDSFQYTVISDDGRGNSSSDTATVAINVTGTNDAPVAVEDSYTLTEDAPFSTPAPGVLANDTDIDPSTVLTAVQVSGPTHASSFILNPDGSFSYTPNPDYSGPDSFTYSANDGILDSTPVTVSLFVSAVDDPLTAGDDNFVVQEDTPTALAVLANDNDPDGPAAVLQINGVTDPPHGSVTINGNGTLTYTPDPDYLGTDVFTYTVISDDGRGNSSSATGTVTIEVVGGGPPVEEEFAGMASAEPPAGFATPFAIFDYN